MQFSVRKLTERTILLVVSISVVFLLMQNGLLQRSRTSYLIVQQTSGETFEVKLIKSNSRRNVSRRHTIGHNQTTTLPPRDTMLQWRQYQREALAVFILSAVGSNFTSKPGYRREIKLNGWEALKHRNKETKCCVFWNSNRYTYYKNPDKVYWKKTTLPATQFTCPIKGPLIDVRGVTLEFYKKRCPTDESVYIRPFLPKVQARHSLAICVKIVYGNVDMKLLVDWMEFYREMKVDKIFMFTYNLTNNIELVLQRYIDTGFLERRQFDFPWKSAGRLKREVGVKTPSVWQDEQVVVFDCYQRLYGYSYIAIVDLDEFLLPRKHRDIKELMKYLTKEYPKAAGFTFKSYIFAKDWNKTVSTSGSDIVQYLRRTPALYTRQKNILIPGRVQPDSIDTHEFQPVTGYQRIIVPETTTAINHYRTCYPNFRTLCHDKKKQIFDDSILNVVEKFHNKTLWINSIQT